MDTPGEARKQGGVEKAAAMNRAVPANLVLAGTCRPKREAVG